MSSCPFECFWRPFRASASRPWFEYLSVPLGMVVAVVEVAGAAIPAAASCKSKGAERDHSTAMSSCEHLLAHIFTKRKHCFHFPRKVRTIVKSCMLLPTLNNKKAQPVLPIGLSSAVLHVATRAGYRGVLDYSCCSFHGSSIAVKIEQLTPRLRKIFSDECKVSLQTYNAQLVRITCIQIPAIYVLHNYSTSALPSRVTHRL